MKTSIYMSNQIVSIIVGDSPKKIAGMYRTVLPEGCMINGIITSNNKISDYLKDYFIKKNIPLDDVSLVIDSTQILTKVLELPRLKEDELISVIDKEMNELTDGDTLVYDYLVLKEDKMKVRYLACAIDESIIESYMELFSNFDVKLSRLNIALGATIKMIEKISLMNNQTGVVIINDGDSLMSVLYENGEYIFSSHTRLYSQHGSLAFANDISRNIEGLQQFLSSQKSQYQINNVYLAGFNQEDFDICKASIDIANVNITELGNDHYNLSSPNSFEDEVSNLSSPKFGNFIFPLGNY